MSFQSTIAHEITEVLLEESAVDWGGGDKRYIVQVLHMKNNDQELYYQCAASQLWNRGWFSPFLFRIRIQAPAETGRLGRLGRTPSFLACVTCDSVLASKMASST